MSGKAPSAKAIEVVNNQDNQGDTALHMAAQHSSPESIQLMLSPQFIAMFKREVENNAGFTAYDVAWLHLRPKNATEFEERGFGVKGSKGTTDLIAATAKKHLVELKSSKSEEVYNVITDMLAKGYTLSEPQSQEIAAALSSEKDKETWNTKLTSAQRARQANWTAAINEAGPLPNGENNENAPLNQIAKFAGLEARVD